ncbi:MAG: hypothetical protein H0X33_13100 [Taibaiella sp.]|nr:hypothetical protein [Taibaiella sp.]
MARTKQFKPQQIIDALVKNHGMVYLSAKELGCEPKTIYNYAKDSPEIQEAINNARGEVTDNAESKLFDAINKGEAWAICFYLKTQGKSRGYVERQEVSGPDGNELVIRVNRDRNPIKPA